MKLARVAARFAREVAAFLPVYLGAGGVALRVGLSKSSARQSRFY